MRRKKVSCWRERMAPVRIRSARILLNWDRLTRIRIDKPESFILQNQMISEIPLTQNAVNFLYWKTGILNASNSVCACCFYSTTSSIFIPLDMTSTYFRFGMIRSCARRNGPFYSKYWVVYSIWSPSIVFRRFWHVLLMTLSEIFHNRKIKITDPCLIHIHYYKMVATSLNHWWIARKLVPLRF